MSINLKKRQHFVWQKYLKEWTCNGKIHVLQDNKIFQSTTRNIAVEKYLYEPKDITHHDIVFLNDLFKPSFNSPDERLRNQINNNWSNFFTLLLNIDQKIVQNKNIQSEISNSIRNTYENLQSNIESLGHKILAKLKSCSEILSIEEMDEFLIFITYQYLRTKKSKEIISQSSANHAKTLIKVWPLLIHYFSNHIAIGLNQNIDKYRIVHYLNNTHINLITGDQPVVLCTSPVSQNSDPETFILYYPLMPKKAICFTTNTVNSLVVELTETDVNSLNRLILHNSLSQCFSNSNEELNKLNTF